MNIRFHNSIALKMTLLVLGGTSIVCSLILAYSYYSSRKIILNEVRKTHKTLPSTARRIEQEFRAVEKVPQGIACFLETTKWNKESLLRVIERSVLDSPELYGS